MHVGAGAHDDSDGDERVPKHGSDDDSSIGSGPSPIDDVHVHRLVVFEGDLFPKAAVDRVPPLTGAAARARARSVSLATRRKKVGMVLSMFFENPELCYSVSRILNTSSQSRTGLAQSDSPGTSSVPRSRSRTPPPV